MHTKWKFSGKQDVYLEVAEYYEKLILRGTLEVGDKLPSVRIAAGELGVNPNTAAKAYAHLESKGYIRAIPKKGAYVVYVPPTSEPQREIVAEDDQPATQKTDSVAELLCKNTITALKDSGVTKESLMKLIEEVYSND